MAGWYCRFHEKRQSFSQLALNKRIFGEKVFNGLGLVVVDISDPSGAVLVPSGSQSFLVFDLHSGVHQDLDEIGQVVCLLLSNLFHDFAG